MGTGSMQTPPTVAERLFLTLGPLIGLFFSFALIFIDIPLHSRKRVVVDFICLSWTPNLEQFHRQENDRRHLYRATRTHAMAMDMGRWKRGSRKDHRQSRNGNERES